MNKNEKEMITDLLLEIGEYYKDNDWLIIKKYLLRYLKPEVRKNFSTRNPKSKKHIINNYENKIIILYKNLFNVKLVLDESKRE
tara:strand:+ start:992 stop:1243 length:252 start_codon:yes stop_codon:yes gene_type:complete